MFIRRLRVLSAFLLAFVLAAACTSRGGGRGGGGGGGGGGDDDDSAGMDDDDATDDDDDDSAPVDDDDDVAVDDDDATDDALYEGSVTGEIVVGGEVYSCVGSGSGVFENGMMSADLECNDESNGVVCSASFNGLFDGGSTSAAYDCWTTAVGTATMEQIGGDFVVTTSLIDEAENFEYYMFATLSPSAE